MRTRAILCPHQPPTRSDATFSVAIVVLPPQAPPADLDTGQGMKDKQSESPSLQLKFIMLLNAFAFRYVRKKSLLTIIHTTYEFHLYTLRRDVARFLFSLSWVVFAFLHTHTHTHTHIYIYIYIYI